MRWYGIVLLFLVCVLFGNILYAVRLDYTVETTAFIEQDFALPKEEIQIYNKETKLSAQTFPNGPALVFFFGTWCKPCMMEHPIIVKLSKRMDVPFIGIAVRDDASKLEQFFKKTENPYNLIGIDKGFTWSRHFDASRLPALYIVDKNGKVVTKIRGFLTEDFYLQEVLPRLHALASENAGDKK